VFASKAQRFKMRLMAERGEITREALQQVEAESRGLDIPEYSQSPAAVQARLGKRVDQVRHILRSKCKHA